MKLSLRWLNDFVDVSDALKDPQGLARALTNAGLEVESIEDQGKPFHNVVVGHILEKGKHPGADRLSLCQVTTGGGVIHQIVCGAQNHKQGDCVVVALPGAILPGDFAIKHSKIRGVESGGMLCSLKELGLATESEGIVILPSDAPIGVPFAEYKKLDDVIFELKVTPNRADCLSHRGLALEIACLLGKPICEPESKIEEGDFDCDIGVAIRAADLGPRYAGRMIKGVKVGESPEWLKRRLETVGMKSINNVVDVTNYVMMELGQPLHAFDVRELRGRTIIVDRAVSGEAFVTLDGSELKLDGTELTIRDSERAVALAGVVGGKNSGVQDDTVDVMIEAAYFTPASVRRTMRKFGIETDSGYRFSRGVNPESTTQALDRATQLMIEVAGGKASRNRIDVYPEPVPRAEIQIALSTVESRLGYSIEASVFEMWMKRLGGELRVLSPGLYKFVAPAHRMDLHIDMDLVEEFGRLNGYDKIPETLPVGGFMPAAHDELYMAEMRARRILKGMGCLQALNYAFIGDSYQKDFIGDVELWCDAGLFVDGSDVRIVNPLNEEINVMRRSLLPGLYRNLLHGVRFGSPMGRLFEIGVSVHAVSDRSQAVRTERFQGTAYGEEKRLGFCFWGGETDLWGRKQAAESAVTLKGVVESFLKTYGVSSVDCEPFDEGRTPGILHPGKAVVVRANRVPVGFLGAIHPSRLQLDKVRTGAAIGEFSLEKILKAISAVRFVPISTFPAMERDVALVGAKSIPAGEIVTDFMKLARKFEADGGRFLKSASVFDVFEGESLGEGKRSVAVRMVFQSADGTLEDAVVNQVRDKLVQAICEKHGVSVR